VPWEPLGDLGRMLPLNAGNQLITVSPAADGLSRGAALTVLLVWATTALGAGGWRLTRTDV
jgi:hypothetical protein